MTAIKYINEVQGYNSRLDPIQAAVLRVKLKYLDAWNARRSLIADQYSQGLAGAGLALPTVHDRTVPVWHLFVVRHRFRDELQQKLTEAGIGSVIHYPIPPHKQQAYSTLNLAESDFPLASKMAREVISLPMGPHLDADALQTVIEEVLAVA